MLRIRYLFSALLLMLLFTACEDIFTNNVFSNFQRDPDNLSKDQLLSRAAYVGGDRAEAAKLYEALKTKISAGDDAEVFLVMTNLALTASGVLDELQDLVKIGIDGDLDDAEALSGALDDKLNNVNYTYVQEAQQQILAARAAGGTVSTDQYVFVTIGLIMQEANEQGTRVGDLTFVPDSPLASFVDEAVADLEAQGKSGTALRELRIFLGSE
ncbi:MAG: hypothetical protein EA428_16075 [Spirochaetaceae bacterium]|nr:MAG: hypothetical protein EA428_16075 [Spirochaetaceae bacterium]